MRYRCIRIFSLLIGFLAINASVAFAQNTKRGFKTLEKSDYQKSMEQFKSALAENNDNAAALLGLTLIMADDSSSFFDLIGAWKYACQLKPLVEKFSAEELEYIGEYFYNTETRHISRPVKKKIEYALETVEAKLIKYVREENNLDVVYAVLKEFPDFRYYDNVIHIRNQLEFRKYEKQNTLEAYVTFIEKFPEAAQVEKAIRYRNRLAFDNARKINTVKAYEDYMDQYPDADDINQAIKSLHKVAFGQAKTENTVQAFDRFIASYPDALEIAEAKIIQKQLLYEYAKRIQSLEAYNEFIRKYPDGQQYIDIFNLKAREKGMRFIATHTLPSANIEWARCFEDEALVELNACAGIDSMNAYYLASTVFKPDTGFTDVWIIKTDAEGKMVWNKTIGEGYNDEISLMDINFQNEIIGAGYTWSGMDSSSRETWIFKLGVDGTKIWSKKMGRFFVNDLAPARSGNIYLGGYVVNDSLQRLYSIVVLNKQGRRQWGRTYTGKGEIIDIAEFADHNMLLAGNHWRAKIDPRGYLLWESAFNPADSIVSANIMPNGEIVYLGYRNKNSVVVTRTSGENKTLTEKTIPLPVMQAAVVDVIVAGRNQLVALIAYENRQLLYWVNTQTCELVSASQLPDGCAFTDMAIDRKNNLLLVSGDKEVILVKNRGVQF